MKEAEWRKCLSAAEERVKDLVQKTQGTAARAKRLSLPVMSGLYAYMYSMMLSAALVGIPVFGGALYMCAGVLTSALRTVTRQTWRERRRLEKVLIVCGYSLMFLAALALWVLFPMQLEDPKVWILFGLILTMVMCDLSCRRLIRLCVARQMPEKRFLTLFGALHLVPPCIAAWLLFLSLETVTAWQLLGGFLLLNVLEVYSQLKDREEQRVLLAPVPQEQYDYLKEKMLGTNAYRTYNALSAWIVAALEITMVLMYTFLAITAEQLLTCMILSFGSTLLAREATEFVMRRREARRTGEPTVALLIGMFLWLYALALFGGAMHTGELVNGYIGLGLCSCGVTICTTVLSRMERVMAQVAQFSAGEETRGYWQLRAFSGEAAVLVGQMIALFALTILSLNARSISVDTATIGAAFRPLMLVPAMLMVVGALLSALRFPLSQRYMEKLGHFLQLRQEGAENPALQKQLEQVVVARHRQPFTINLVKAVLRPFFRHTLHGLENIHGDDENPIVFLCNHGELYGPVAAMLNIPLPVRPWTISEITVDKDEVSAYIYKYTISRQKWLPESWKMPVAKLIGPISVWAMRSLESIPVYRNRPRDLMTTFRLSSEALQAGDNLLIFPENPNAEYEGHGYERHGLGELFSGFAMLAPIYYNKTGKKCRFLPVYAHQQMRSMTFAPEIVYDPDAEPGPERDRIVQYLQDVMEQMYETEEAKYQAKVKEKTASKREKPGE